MDNHPFAWLSAVMVFAGLVFGLVLVPFAVALLIAARSVASNF